MAETSIQWTATPRPDGTEAQGFTFNPWIGCTKISPGCANCYAERDAHHWQRAKWGPQGTRTKTSEAYWKKPLAWNRLAERTGTRLKVFCASEADFAEEWTGPILDHERYRLYAAAEGCFVREPTPRPVTMADLRIELFKLIGQTPCLDWLLLTKRPQTCVEHWPLWAGYALGGAIRRHLPIDGLLRDSLVIPNVWLGVSVEDQQRADERIPLLLQIPARVRFLSVEPLLGPVDLNPWLWDAKGDCKPFRIPGIDWVIIGGESGPGARPCEVQWIRCLVRQCQNARVPVFVKQLGACYSDPVNGVAGRKLYIPPEALGLMSRRLVDAKGGDLEEFPDEMRIREFPCP